MWASLQKMLKMLKGPKVKKPKPTILKAKKIDKLKLMEIRKEVREQYEKMVGDIEHFCSVVETLNEGLIDSRLEDAAGTMKVMAEIRDYHVLFDEFLIPVICGKKDDKGRKMIYFEV